VPYGLVALDNHLYTTDGNLEFVQELDADARPTRRLLEYPLSIHVLTEITAGPDGALYVAEMGFWPYPEGSGRVTRLTLDGQASPAASGVTASLGVTVGPDGALYVLEHSQPLRQTKNTGRLVRINSDGQPETVVDGLNLPTAVVTGPDGALYIANGGNRTPDGKGEVLRVELPRAGLHLLGSGRIV
jgi:sugar lactone lactonase YvrE